MLRLRDVIMTFKCLKSLTPTYVLDKFKVISQVHNRNTMGKNTLQIPLHRTVSDQRSFLYRAATFWNELLDSLRSLDSVNSFKVSIRKIFEQLKLNLS